ncbi:MAG: hypothetical protein RIQ89_1506 [Bacteroidota bacterium]
MAAAVPAQVTNVSPYSRFGIGDLQFRGVARQEALGGTAMGQYSQYHINMLNPASYSAITLTAFDVAGSGIISSMNNGQQQQLSNASSLAYFMLAAPLKAAKGGMSFGLVPFSNRGYSIDELVTDQNNLRQVSNYEGKGGLSQLYMGMGWEVARNFRLGANVSYLFGGLTNTRSLDYTNSTSYRSLALRERINAGNFQFNVGFQYTVDSIKISRSDSLVKNFDQQHKLQKLRGEWQHRLRNLASEAPNTAGGNEKLQEITARLDSIDRALVLVKKERSTIGLRTKKDQWSFTFGANVAPQTSLNAVRSLFVESYIFSNDQRVDVDTLVNTDQEKGKLIIPLMAQLGIGLKKGSQWWIGADVSYQAWQNYRLFDQADSLLNTTRAMVGIQFTPNDRNSTSYFQAMQYRAGAYYSTDWLKIRGAGINERGVSCGIGLPFRRKQDTFGMLNLTAQFGERGTLSQGLIKEKFARLTFGLIFNQAWFYRPKYD